MPTQPSHNLITDGIDKCADYVLAALRRKKVMCSVYIDRAGGVRVRTAHNYRADEVRERPESEFVCSYSRATACLEYIREDLSYKLAHMPKYVTSKAA